MSARFNVQITDNQGATTTIHPEIYDSVYWDAAGNYHTLQPLPIPKGEHDGANEITQINDLGIVIAELGQLIPAHPENSPMIWNSLTAEPVFSAYTGYNYDLNNRSERLETVSEFTEESHLIGTKTYKLGIGYWGKINESNIQQPNGSGAFQSIPYTQIIGARGQLADNISATLWVKSLGKNEYVGIDLNQRLATTAEAGTRLVSGNSISNNGLILAGREEPASGDIEDVILLPFELSSDLNNDGKISGADSTLKSDGAKSDASDEQKEKAIEYLFVNDTLSNGLWDKDDSAKPANHKEDDDLTEISTVCAATWGAVWFEYEGGDITKLSIYKSKECTAANYITFPFPLTTEATGKLPEKLYVRAEGDWTGQIEGKLIMKFGKADKSETWATEKLNFTVVKQIGDTKYFNAACDYMMEQNSRLFVRYFKSGQNQIRITAMRSESTDMKVIETYNPNPKIYGMPNVVSKSQDYYDLILNGNFCYFEGGIAGRAWGIANHDMTSRCHGGCVVGSSQNSATSVGGSNAFEQSDAEFLSSNGKGTFNIATGVVPLNPPAHQAALGGFASNLVGGAYNTHPWFGIAEIGATNERKKIIFTVSQTSPNTQYPLADLVQRLTNSGQTICVAGDGGSSTAVAHRIEGDTTRVKYAGDKHYPGHYWINTYVAFKSEKPRP